MKMERERYIKARTLIKSEALNKIAKIYHPLYKFPYDRWDERTYTEQRESAISYIIYTMNRKLKLLKDKFQNQSKTK